MWEWGGRWGCIRRLIKCAEGINLHVFVMCDVLVEISWTWCVFQERVVLRKTSAADVRPLCRTLGTHPSGNSRLVLIFHIANGLFCVTAFLLPWQQTNLSQGRYGKNSVRQICELALSFITLQIRLEIRIKTRRRPLPVMSCGYRLSDTMCC